MNKYGHLTEAVKGADAVLLVFSMGDRASFEFVTKTLRNLRTQKVKAMMVATMGDLLASRAVGEGELKGVREAFGVPLCHVDNTDTEKPFHERRSTCELLKCLLGVLMPRGGLDVIGERTAE